MEKTILKNELKIKDLKSVTFSTDKVCQLFFYGNKVFRAIKPNYVNDIKEMFYNGLIQELLDKELFIETWISETKIEGFDLVLEHKFIEYWNYPYEWSFEMLKDAATVVLDVNKIANKFGYELFDVHAFNVVYDMARPKYIDLGSFFKMDKKNGKCWSGYLNFYHSFYMPLYLYKKGFSDLSQSVFLYNGFFSNRDFFNLRFKYLGILGSNISNLIFKLYDNSRRLAVARHFKVLEKYGKHKQIKYLIKFKKNLQNKFNLNKSYKFLAQIKNSRFESYWNNYQDEINPENDKRFCRIKELINNEFNDAQTLLELASNQGKFANFILDNTSINKVIATDYDKNALDKVYLNNKNKNNILPLVYDFVRPNGRSCDNKLENRIKADIVMALAVTHHLILSQDIELKHIFDVLKAHTNKYIIVEFMPLGLYSGSMENIPPIPEYYTLNWFKKTFSEHFDHCLDEEIDVNRHLFLGKIKN